ncbi:hypothetical protein BGZ60DRAFT_566537 [Tricladium varicosporioides]|nr:hypothetical protein BGZ60DRAFT_566537 [Hymenoscyphus varicosporioides]
MMKEFLNNLRWSRRFFNFLAITVLLNIILTNGLIPNQPPPTVTRRAEFVKAQCTKLALLAAVNNGESIEGDRLQDINGMVRVAVGYVWSFAQMMSWWNMAVAYRDFTENASNAINCLRGIITGVITLAASGTKLAIWYGQVTNAYIDGRSEIYPPPQASLGDLGVVTGHDVKYHGTWGHTQLGLDYSEVEWGARNRRTYFGITRPDGAESWFSYLGNSVEDRAFRPHIECESRSNIVRFKQIAVTYDHRLRRIEHPVRSAVHKP